MIDRASDTDLDALVALEASGFDHAGWSRDAWAAELQGAGRLVLIERDDAVPGGARGAAAFSILFDTADLLRVVVAPPHRGRGLGRRLVQAGLEWALEQGAERMMLEVEQGNAPARALYDRLGFAAITTRHDYYGAGLHALVMERPLAPATIQAPSSAAQTLARQRHSERTSA